MCHISFVKAEMRRQTSLWIDIRDRHMEKGRGGNAKLPMAGKTTSWLRELEEAVPGSVDVNSVLQSEENPFKIKEKFSWCGWVWRCLLRNNSKTQSHTNTFKSDWASSASTWPTVHNTAGHANLSGPLQPSLVYSQLSVSASELCHPQLCQLCHPVC